MKNICKYKVLIDSLKSYVRHHFIESNEQKIQDHVNRILNNSSG